MATTDDTTLFREGGEELRALKEEARLHAEKDLAELHAWSLCLKRRGVSPGGAADLLALVIHLERSVHLFSETDRDGTEGRTLV